ncbi:hypothetical protein Goarm_022998, partial [Gossypium armourianum]|nr:hypothetical protein [Gossypium armourianum]
MEDAWIPGYANYKINRILQIPLATIEHDDMLVWKGESLGEFTVRSAYKLLLDSPTGEFGWAVHLPADSVKIAVTVRLDTEAEALSNKSLTKQLSSSEWRPLENHMVPINFDAAFSQQHFRSTSGLVFRNEKGEVIVSKSILTNRIAFSFAAEAFACSQAVRLGMGVDAVEIERDAL